MFQPIAKTISLDFVNEAVHLDEIVDDDILYFPLVHLHAELVELGQVLSQKQHINSHFFFGLHE